MRTNDFSATITAHALNESMFKKFGVKINFDKYDRNQLENYRNLLRTKLHQEEVASNFNALLSNESYQKDKYMLDLLNTKIKEMIGESKKQKPLKGGQTKLDVDKDGKLEKSDFAKLRAGKKSKVKEGKASAAEMAHHYAMEYMKAHRKGNIELCQEYRDACEGYGGKLSHGTTGECYHSHQSIGSGAPYAVQEGVIGGVLGAAAGAALGGPIGGMAGYAAGSKAGDDLASESRSVKEGKKAKKDYDGDGEVESGKDEYFGSKDKAIKNAMKKKVKESISESIARFIAEDEEGKAKSITAGLDMVNDFTSWMQRIATYQTKSMIELSDQIRAHFGDESAQRFKQETYQALEASLNALTQSREQLSNAVAVLAGEAPPEEPMGSEPAMDADMSGDEGGEMAGEEMPPEEDEFAAADAAAAAPAAPVGGGPAMALEAPAAPPGLAQPTAASANKALLLAGAGASDVVDTRPLAEAQG
jgi:hypothetical protein